MRLPLIFAPFGLLLLVSCEPGDGTSDAGKGLLRERREKAGVDIPGDASSPEGLAAQDSVGKPPAARNLIASVADTCPLHHEKMKAREVPIVFEGTPADASRPTDPVSSPEFPFSAEKIVSAGNALLPGEPVTARVYQCASCIAAKKAADEKRVPSGVPVAAQ